MNGYLIAGLLVAIIVLLLATNKKLVETLKNMYKIEELRKRIFYTIGLLLVYRLGCFVVIPGINPNMLGADSALADQMNSNSLLGLLDVFSGFERMLPLWRLASASSSVPSLSWSSEGRNRSRSTSLFPRRKFSCLEGALPSPRTSR